MHCYYHRIALVAVALLAFMPHSLTAQDIPCRDTMVAVFDTICEGEEYDFNGRMLSYSGYFYDTLPRVNGGCDSVIVLKLNVLEYCEVFIFLRRHCRGNVGYELSAAYPQIVYYDWSSQPHDSTLDGQEDWPWVFVNPQVPTTYSVRVAYSSDGQLCASDGSRKINPIETVTASMHVWPQVLTYDYMDIVLEDFSTGTREAHWDGWAGRHWYINGVRQENNQEQATFPVDPWWGDTVDIMMEAYTPTCVDTAYKRIPFHRVAVYFPNVFTPDADNNNEFRPYVQGVLQYELWIYDRQGHKVFHTIDVEDAWDGTAEGVRCPQGTYTYFCRFSEVDNPAGSQSRTGSVTLLR